jgi:benzoyl-CoA reductase/2-hydroxyglutaryl-CoA dehydratase subunit BcrC/BadD/HgdB
MAGWDDIQAVLDDELRAARLAKARGQAVVGVLSNNVPVELIHAAGAFALQLPTAPLPVTALADQYLERAFDPQARSALERLLRGDFALIDLLVLPRSVDSFQRLYYYLCELRRSFGLQLPEPFLYDILQTPWPTSDQYSHASTLELARRLAALTGRPLGVTQLAHSIASYNRVRERLTEVLAWRHRIPCRLRGERAHMLLTAATRLAPEEFSAALAGCSEDVPGSRTRVLLAGSAQDTPALHRLIAAAGGEVVCDYHWRGDLLFGPPIEEQGDPFEAVSRHYQRHSFSARTFAPPADRLRELREFTEHSRADCAVFYYHAEDDALCWDYNAQREAIGLPTLLLSIQPYAPDPALLTPLREFLRGLAIEPSVARSPVS